MLKRIQSYLIFFIKSLKKQKKNSTFFYQIIKKRKTKNFDTYKEYKKQLLRNKKSIEVTDFGAGSSVFSSDERQVSKIAKVAGINNKRAKILMNFIEYYKPKSILEIGTSLGLATATMGISNKNCKIISLEGCPETAKIAQHQFDKFNLNNINLIVGDFAETLPKVTKNKNYDFIYFDGNHQKEATLNYFKTSLPTVNEKSIFIFDDIHWNSSMEEAWNEIKLHPKVITTIDTFQWGIVFFKKEPSKENYTVRI